MKGYLVNKRIYTLVECLEEHTDFWNVGKTIKLFDGHYRMQPAKYHIIPKPRLSDERKDAEARMDLSRFSYYYTPNPLKSYDAPGPLKKYKQTTMEVPQTRKRRIKHRRLSKTKILHKRFSTSIEREMVNDGGVGIVGIGDLIGKKDFTQWKQD